LQSWRDFRNPLSDRQAYLSKWGRGLCEELFKDGLSVVYPYFILQGIQQFQTSFFHISIFHHLLSTSDER
jgi:hypothetical protein